MACPHELTNALVADFGSEADLCEIARPLIQAKARQLGCKPGFTISDVDDIQQEAYMRRSSATMTQTAKNALSWSLSTRRVKCSHSPAVVVWLQAELPRPVS